MRNRNVVPIFLLILILLVIGAVVWLAHDLVQDLPSRFLDESSRRLQTQAKTLRDQFFAVANFQPVIRIKDRVVYEKNVEVAELAVVSRPTEVTREFIHTWAGSTKKLRLRGTFQVRSGFDLNEKFEILLGQGKTKVVLPRARILSVEQTELKVEALENGLWNVISAQDIQTETGALRDLARQQSAQLNAEAENNFRARLRTIFGKDIELIFEPSSPTPQPQP